MARTKLRLDTRRALTDGTYPVQIAVGYGTNIYLQTGIYLSESDWDAVAQKALGRSARRINQILDTMLVRVANRVLDLRDSGQWDKLTPPQLRQMLRNLELEAPTVDIPTLRSLFEVVAASKKKQTAAHYWAALKKLDAFCNIDDLNIDTITKAWLDRFYNSFEASVNYKGLVFSCLHSVFNYALDEGITTNNPFLRYRIPLEETAMRVLPIEKMRSIIALPLSGLMAECRDIFVLSFYLIGINMADLGALTKDDIKDGRIEYYRAKTHKFYSIKIIPEAQTIIDRYQGKDHLLRIFDGHTTHTSIITVVNRALKKLGPVVEVNGKKQYTGNHLPITKPIEPKLSGYWARYSWATYAADLDIPKDTISESLGHSHGVAVTGVYIKFSRDKIDAANRKVVDYVLSGLPPTAQV